MATKARVGFVVCLVLLACEEQKRLAKVGDFCSDDKDCESGLCFESKCLALDGDEDGDGLMNGIEKHLLGTNLFSADTDGDGINDYDEVGGDINAPFDSDGDGIIDALESASADLDKDCLPDQFDPHNETPDKEMEKQIARIHCQKSGGVCRDKVDQIMASCEDGEPKCDYSQVDGYEEQETKCDGIDNDCNGETDEGLDGAPCEITNEYGSCTGVFTCIGGEAVCEGQKPEAEKCDEKDNDCDGEIDEDFDLLGEECTVGTGACEAKGRFVCAEDGLDVVCDATPGSPGDENCDGVDNDCDGETDEDFGLLGKECTVGTGACEATGMFVCAEDGLDVVCHGTPGLPSDEKCDAVDNDCDGETDEDNVCPPGTVTITGKLYDGETFEPLVGAIVRVTSINVDSLLGGLNYLTETESDSKGRFVLKVKPNCYKMEISLTGYQGLLMPKVCFSENEIRPFELALAQEDSWLIPLNVCGRVFSYQCDSPDKLPLPFATVQVFGGSNENLLGIGVADGEGYYCVSGLPAKDHNGKEFSQVFVSLSAEGVWPETGSEGIPFIVGHVVLSDLFTSLVCPGHLTSFTLIEEDFENSVEGWDFGKKVHGTGWQIITQGTHTNSALGKCVSEPSKAEDCSFGDAGCYVCRPDQQGCLPAPGSLPNPFGTRAVWFGNASFNNFLSDGSDCTSMNGGVGEQVFGTLYSPFVQLEAQQYGSSVIFTFRAAWEVESVRLFEGVDSLVVGYETEDANGKVEKTVLGRLTPTDVMPIKSGVGYSSAGFARPPLWGVFGYYFWVRPEIQKVRVFFTFDSVDGTENGFRGVLIDEIRLSQLLGP